MENEGRKLFFDTFVLNQRYAMQSQHSIFDDFENSSHAKPWKRKNPLFIVVACADRGHYTGIRVDLNGKVTLFDPNPNPKLIKPEMREIIGNAFGSTPFDYEETCQTTVAVHSWALYLVTHPDFHPPESINAIYL